MRVQLAPELTRKLKKKDVRIRKGFKATIDLFSEDPNTPKLHNHALRKKWAGFRSINITADLRAIYKEVKDEDEMLAYFVAVGTHKELYGS